MRTEIIPYHTDPQDWNLAGLPLLDFPVPSEAENHRRALASLGRQKTGVRGTTCDLEDLGSLANRLRGTSERHTY